MSVNEMLMAAAGQAGGAAEYVEDVFSTYLYTGTGTTQTITNNIDLAGEGGMVWTKTRGGTENHWVYSTAQGTGGTGLITNTTDSSSAYSNYNNMSSFNADGFTLGTASAGNQSNPNGTTAVSWTFRKAPKFFDVVTYTGNGTAGRTISHNLGSVPGMMIVKCTSTSGNWSVYHRSTGATDRLILNLTNATGANNTIWNDTTPTSTVFTVGDNAGVNSSGATYVAYLFAHNAGGFGTAGTDNIISCGSFTTDGSGIATVTLGYEPQFVLWKQTDGADNWYLNDIMRGMSVGSSDRNLSPNTSGAESAGGYETDPTATGFIANPGIASKNYIYMAIRRPMKTPTSGTEVFKPVARAGTDSSVTIDAGFTVDMNIATSRDKAIQSNTPVVDRLRGGSIGHPYLRTNTSNPDNTGTASGMYEFTQNGVYTYNTIFNSSSETYVHWMFKRAPEFFDIVCYKGTGSTRTLTHNLTIPPELIIVKNRTNSSDWFVYHNAYGANYRGILNSTSNWSTNSTIWNNTEPTSTVFTVGASTDVNTSGDDYVAYLFSTLAGISKVGSYTGNGSSQTINCGFTAGARFVLIKSGNNNTDWCVFDTARGIVSGNDPFMRINTTVAEITGQDAVDPTNSGFIVNETTELLNTDTKTYLYLAIA